VARVEADGLGEAGDRGDAAADGLGEGDGVTGDRDGMGVGSSAFADVGKKTTSASDSAAPSRMVRSMPRKSAGER
jgi:hypothetical protein